MQRASLQDVVNAGGVYVNWLISHPFYTCMDVSAYCNLSCAGCNYPDLQKNNLLEQPSLETLIGRTVTLYKTFGPQILNLADGEPTTYSGLARLIQAASQRHLVTISTNGTLITEKKAIDYWRAGMQLATVSLSTLDNERYHNIIGTSRYNVEDVQHSIETLLRTGPNGILPRVAIAVTIDNLTTPQELEELARYAKEVHAPLSPQLYSSYKQEFRTVSHSDAEDPRKIVAETFEERFDGGLVTFLSVLQKRYKVFTMRKKVLDDFNEYLAKGEIPWKPGRILTVQLDGALKLEPEGNPIISFDSASHEEIRNAVWTAVYAARKNGKPHDKSCYRCLTVTTPSTPFGDILIEIARRLKLETKFRFA